MFENFLKIDITKQKRVLAAALEVFSREGYLRANTNEIAALAEISKGLLFHYFGSKKNLYFLKGCRELHFVNFFFTKSTQATVGNKLSNFLKIYFILKTIGVDHKL